MFVRVKETFTHQHFEISMMCLLLAWNIHPDNLPINIPLRLEFVCAYSTDCAYKYSKHFSLLDSRRFLLHLSSKLKLTSCLSLHNQFPPYMSTETKRLLNTFAAKTKLLGILESTVQSSQNT